MIDGIFSSVKSGVTASRSRSVGSASTATNTLPAFDTSPPQLSSTAEALSIAHTVVDLSLVTATKVRVGVQYGAELWWLMERPATANAKDGVVSGTWHRKVYSPSP